MTAELLRELADLFSREAVAVLEERELDFHDAVLEADRLDGIADEIMVRAARAQNRKGTSR